MPRTTKLLCPHHYTAYIQTAVVRSTYITDASQLQRKTKQITRNQPAKGGLALPVFCLREIASPITAATVASRGSRLKEEWTTTGGLTPITIYYTFFRTWDFVDTGDFSIVSEQVGFTFAFLSGMLLLVAKNDNIVVSLNRYATFEKKKKENQRNGLKNESSCLTQIAHCSGVFFFFFSW